MIPTTSFITSLIITFFLASAIARIFYKRGFFAGAEMGAAEVVKTKMAQERLFEILIRELSTSARSEIVAVIEKKGLKGSHQKS